MDQAVRGVLVLLLMFGSAGGALAINKCVGAGGKVSYQEAACAGAGGAIAIKPARGVDAPTPVPAQTPAQADAATPTAAKPKEGPFGASYQRRFFLENRGVPDARAATQYNKLECERKLKKLEADKAGARNNLAGATYLQSLAATMQAEATMCDMRARELQTRQQELERELRELQAQQP